jgi:hypothetical protein
MTVALPLEILEIIGLHFDRSVSSFKLILGMKINKDQVFREGGLGVIIRLVNIGRFRNLNGDNIKIIWSY